MEYVQGASLADALNHAPQSAVTSAEMVEVLARAMHHAHKQGIVHRDLNRRTSFWRSGQVMASI